jgi:hypothetical protein
MRLAPNLHEQHFLVSKSIVKSLDVQRVPYLGHQVAQKMMQKDVELIILQVTLML